MFCKYCGNHNKKNSRQCTTCHRKIKNKQYLIGLFVMLVFLSFAGFFINNLVDSILTEESSKNDETTNEKIDHVNETKESTEPLYFEQDLKALIETAKESVYTVESDELQGSGFLYNDQGIVVTNAHVVEGSLNVIVKNNSGKDMFGTVMGYSNKLDVAIIQVDDLIGEEPYPLELNKPAEIGEYVVAIGSPSGVEDTTTQGYLIGINSDLVIRTYIYEDIYQITASIEHGNSGGALISVDTQQIIAINSAKSTEVDSIGYSLPLYQAAPLIEEWIENPMSVGAILDEYEEINEYENVAY